MPVTRWSSSRTSHTQSVRSPRFFRAVVAFATLALASAFPVWAQCGPTWQTQIGNPGINILGRVYALATLPGGDLIVAGQFSSAGGIAANNIARYNPSTGVWSALGAGTGGRINALAVVPPGLTGAGDVIVGGEFVSAGGVAGRNRVARYSPATNTWSALGTGVNDGIVSALAIIPSGFTGAGDIFIGGSFGGAGTVAGATSLVRFTPSTSTWSTVGAPSGVRLGGTGGTVNALAIVPAGTPNAGDLIVGGRFDIVGGVAGRNNVARYSRATDTWSSIGSGTNEVVLSLNALPSGHPAAGQIVVGGAFTNIGGVAVNNIGRLNLSTGAGLALGSGGADGPVYGLSLQSDGDVIAVGAFYSLANATANFGIARFDFGTNLWTNVGGIGPKATDGEAYTVTRLNNDDIVIGGLILNIGSLPAIHVARYTFNGGATITTQPVSQAVCAGSPVSFSVAATPNGNGAPTYQWRRAGVNISTATNPSAGTATLTLSNVQAGDAAGYDCVVTSGCSNTSNTAFLTVNPLPNFFLPPPATATGCPGGTVNISLFVHSSSGNVTYQWRKGTTNINTVTNPTAATNSLKLTNLQSADAGSYNCVVTNSCGSTTSSSTVVSIGGGASVTQHPAAAAPCPGGTATFSVTAAGSDTISYRWYKDNTAINLATNPSAGTRTLTVSGVRGANAGQYKCFVSNSCGSAFSNAATLKVCAADLNCDQIVDDSDFVLFADGYNLLECGNPAMQAGCPADINADNFVDDSDFVAFADGYNALICP